MKNASIKMADSSLHKYFTYILLGVVGLLAVTSYLKNEENSLLLRKLQLHQESTIGGEHNRRRRNIKDGDVDDGLGINNVDSETVHFNTKEIEAIVKKYANKTFHREIKEILENFISTSPDIKLCDKCFEDSRTENKDEKVSHKSKQLSTSYEGNQCLGDYQPELKFHQLEKSVNIGEDVAFECTFFGSPLPQIKWESSAMDSNVTICIDKASSQITSRLHVKNVAWKNRGPVRCIANSINGEASKTGMLNVHGPPRILLPDGPLVAPIGTNLKFPECKVESYPPAQITWRKLYNEELYEDRKPFEKVPAGVFDISRVTEDDEGTYECTATNSLGESRKVIQLKTKMLHFKSKLPRVMAPTGKTTRLTCSAYGNPEIMRGRFYKFDTIIPHQEVRTDNLFTITAVVSSSNFYRCEIEFGATSIVSGSMVKF